MADKEERRYKCGYCGNTFKKIVGTSDGGKHTRVSSQVQCLCCGNFLKTYEGSIFIRDIKEED